jgi:hypothetical protein
MQQGIPRGWTVLDSSKIDTDKSLTHPQTDPYVDTSSNDKQQPRIILIEKRIIS